MYDDTAVYLRIQHFSAKSIKLCDRNAPSGGQQFGMNKRTIHTFHFAFEGSRVNDTFSQHSADNWTTQENPNKIIIWASAARVQVYVRCMNLIYVFFFDYIELFPISYLNVFNEPKINQEKVQFFFCVHGDARHNNFFFFF